MTTMPTSGAPAPGQALQPAPTGHSRDRRGSPIPTAGMITTKVMELRKRRGLMIALIALSTGFPAVFLLIRLLGHAFAPRANPPAGGDQIFVVLVAGFSLLLASGRSLGNALYFTFLDAAGTAVTRADLPVTEKAAREVLSLPVHPSLTAADLEHIVSAVNAVVADVVGAAA